MSNSEELCKYCVKKGLLNKIQFFQINSDQAMKLCQDPKCISAFVDEDPACWITTHNVLLGNVSVSEKLLNEWEKDLNEFLDFPNSDAVLSLSDGIAETYNRYKKNKSEISERNDQFFLPKANLFQNQNKIPNDCDFDSSTSRTEAHNLLVNSENVNSNLNLFSALRKELKPKSKMGPKFEPYISKSLSQVKNKYIGNGLPSRTADKSDHFDNDIFDDLDSFLNQCDDIKSDNIMAEISSLEKLLDSDACMDVETDHGVQKPMTGGALMQTYGTSQKSPIDIALEKYLAEEISQLKADTKNLNYKGISNAKCVKSFLTKPTAENAELIQNALSRVSNPSIIRALNLLKITKGISVNLSSFSDETLSSKAAPKLRNKPLPRKTYVRRKRTNFSQKMVKDYFKEMNFPSRTSIVQATGSKNGSLVLAPVTSKLALKSHGTDIQAAPLIPFIITTEPPKKLPRKPTTSQLRTGKREYILKPPTSLSSSIHHAKHPTTQDGTHSGAHLFTSNLNIANNPAQTESNEKSGTAGPPATPQLTTVQSPLVQTSKTGSFTPSNIACVINPVSCNIQQPIILYRSLPNASFKRNNSPIILYSLPYSVGNSKLLSKTLSKQPFMLQPLAHQDTSQCQTAANPSQGSSIATLTSLKSPSCQSLSHSSKDSVISVQSIGNHPLTITTNEHSSERKSVYLTEQSPIPSTSKNTDLYFTTFSQEESQRDILKTSPDFAEN